MTTKIFRSLLISYVTSVITGFISMMVSGLLFSEHITSNDPPPLIIVSIFLSIFISFGLCLAVFLPISVMDKENIEKLSFEDLIRRYLPIITLPLAIVFCLVLILTFNQAEFYFLLCIISSVFCLSYVGLWEFVRRIKNENTSSQ